MRATTDSNIYTNSKEHTPGDSALPQPLKSSSMLYSNNGLYVDRRRIFGTNRIPEKNTKLSLPIFCIALTNKALLLLTVVAAAEIVSSLYRVLQQHDSDRYRKRLIESTTIIASVFIAVAIRTLIIYQCQRWSLKLENKVTRNPYCVYKTADGDDRKRIVR